MQVNTRASHDAMTARMTGLAVRLDRVRASIATQTRILSPDDDPIGAARLLTIDRALAVGARQQAGIDRAASRLGTADAALDGVATVLQRTKEITLLAANATFNPADRATLAAEVGQLHEQMLGLANARDSDGGSVFAGARTGAPAYAADAAGAVGWQGAGTAAMLALDSGTIATSVDGPAVFDGLAGGTNAFAMLDDLRAALAEPDAAVRTTSLATAQASTDAAIARVADARAAIGTRLARLDLDGARIDAAAVELESDRFATDGFDMAASIARMQRLSTVLEAAQLSFARVSSLSLWDVLS